MEILASVVYDANLCRWIKSQRVNFINKMQIFWNFWILINFFCENEKNFAHRHFRKIIVATFVLTRSYVLKFGQKLKLLKCLRRNPFILEIIQSLFFRSIKIVSMIKTRSVITCKISSRPVILGAEMEFAHHCRGKATINIFWKVASWA